MNSYKELKRKFVLPHEESVASDIATLSPGERFLFWLLTVVLIGSALILLVQVNQFLLVEKPARGGALSEGVIGTPRFINPVLAISDADRDLTKLVYSGLLRNSGGELIPDLAESYSISEDGLTYTVMLREDAIFHDGTPLTTADVFFTVTKAQDPTLKSPRRASWDGVLVEIVSDLEIQFILEEPYSPFVENLTLGILPVHIWRGVDPDQFPFSQLNVEPVGSGPYEIKDIKRNSSGLPETYRLSSFPSFALGQPYIDTVNIMFYQSEEALFDAYLDNKISSINSVSPELLSQLDEDISITTAPLSRVFGVFLNQNQAPLFIDSTVREALNMALDRDRVVGSVLFGYGSPVDSPLPPGVLPTDRPLIATDKAKTIELLEADGWILDEEEGVRIKESGDEKERLSFSLSTSNIPELKEVALILESEWQQIGAHVDLKFFETSDLNQNVIRPRRYDALLFGEVIGREVDLFSFWHSSQRNDPGLNIALYANITADQLLEDTRSTSDQIERIALFEEFEKEVAADTPAVFIYSPDFIYITPPGVKALTLGSITTADERFDSIHEWYIETEHVWNFLTNI